MSRLQSVQIAAARVVTGTWRCEHITPVLCLLRTTLGDRAFAVTGPRAWKQYLKTYLFSLSF